MIHKNLVGTIPPDYLVNNKDKNVYRYAVRGEKDRERDRENDSKRGHKLLHEKVT